MRRQIVRSVPKWGWALGVLFFPSGPFIALACDKVMSWGWAIAGAISSYACLIGFVIAMKTVDRNWGTNGLVQSAFLLGGVLMFTAWGWVEYQIGRNSDYWSHEGRRAWRWAGGLAAALVGLIILGIALNLTVG